MAGAAGEQKQDTAASCRGEGGSPAGLASGQSDLLFQSLVSLVLTMPLKLCCPPPAAPCALCTQVVGSRNAHEC